MNTPVEIDIEFLRYIANKEPMYAVLSPDARKLVEALENAGLIERISTDIRATDAGREALKKHDMKVTAEKWGMTGSEFFALMTGDELPNPDEVIRDLKAKLARVEAALDEARKIVKYYYDPIDPVFHEFMNALADDAGR